MKNENLFKFKSFAQMLQKLPDDNSCREYLEKTKWIYLNINRQAGTGPTSKGGNTHSTNVVLVKKEYHFTRHHKGSGSVWCLLVKRSFCKAS